MNPLQSLPEYEAFVYIPDIKHHRVPAPQISFTRPNLPFLLEEVEGLK